MVEMADIISSLNVAQWLKQTMRVQFSAVAKKYCNNGIDFSQQQ